MEEILKEILLKLDSMDKRFDGIDKRLDGMDKRFDGMDKRLDGMDERLDSIEKSQRRMEMKVEQSIEPKIQALFEDRDIVHTKLNSIQTAVDDLTQKVEKQELEIRVIKGGKEPEKKTKDSKKQKVQ